MFLQARCPNCNDTAIILSDRLTQPVFCWGCDKTYIADKTVPVDLMEERRLMTQLNMLVRSGAALINEDPEHYCRNPKKGPGPPASLNVSDNPAP
jgi:hypothetical protein